MPQPGHGIPLTSRMRQKGKDASTKRLAFCSTPTASIGTRLASQKILRAVTQGIGRNRAGGQAPTGDGLDDQNLSANWLRPGIRKRCPPSAFSIQSTARARYAKNRPGMAKEIKQPRQSTPD